MVLNLVPQQKGIFGFYLPVVIAIYNIVSDNFAIFTFISFLYFHWARGNISFIKYLAPSSREKLKKTSV